MCLHSFSFCLSLFFIQRQNCSFLDGGENRIRSRSLAVNWIHRLVRCILVFHFFFIPLPGIPYLPKIRRIICILCFYLRIKWSHLELWDLSFLLLHFNWLDSKFNFEFCYNFTKWRRYLVWVSCFYYVVVRDSIIYKDLSVFCMNELLSL